VYYAIRDGLPREGTAAYLSTKLVTDSFNNWGYVRPMHGPQAENIPTWFLQLFERQGQIPRGDLDGAPAIKPRERFRRVSLTPTGLVYVRL
jgi:hypothetical protein